MDKAHSGWRRLLQFRIRSLPLVVAIAAVAVTWYPRQPAPLRLGLEGYCPVTLVHKEIWTKGDPEHQTVHDDVLYLFARPENQRLFEAAPTHYVPVCSGEDVVRLVDERRHSVGRRAHGVFFEERIFLFDSEETLAKFWSNPGRYNIFALSEDAETAAN